LFCINFLRIPLNRSRI